MEGHPWIFSNEVDKVEGEVTGGEIVTYLPMIINLSAEGI